MPVQESATDPFDFDDWVALHRRDPAAFEARRQMLLGLELARADEGRRELGRRALERYERAVRDRSPAERLSIAAAMMGDSLLELGERLDALGGAMRGERVTDDG